MNVKLQHLIITRIANFCKKKDMLRSHACKKETAYTVSDITIVL
jgi:hypothetical protein